MAESNIGTSRPGGITLQWRQSRIRPANVSDHRIEYDESKPAQRVSLTHGQHLDLTRRGSLAASGCQASPWYTDRHSKKLKKAARRTQGEGGPDHRTYPPSYILQSAHEPDRTYVARMTDRDRA